MGINMALVWITLLLKLNGLRAIWVWWETRDHEPCGFVLHVFVKKEDFFRRVVNKVSLLEVERELYMCSNEPNYCSNYL